MCAYALNLLDLFLTLYALHHGGVELNPLMRSIPVMVTWKTVGVGVLCALLNHFRDTTKLALCGLRLATAVYAAICIHHFYFIMR